MQRSAPPASFLGTLAAIQTAPIARAPMESKVSAHLVAEKGIEGDRYFLGVGAMSRWPGDKRELSLISAEDLDAASHLADAPIPFDQTRRNLLTRGVVLLGLVGVRFQIGEAVAEGICPCQPCGYLDNVAGRTDLRVALKGLGGLRARIVQSGTIRPGDAIAPLPSA
jgi:MOSC domain-containing protein YiiM